MTEFPDVPEIAQPLGYPGATWAFYQARTSGSRLRIPRWGMGDVLVSLLGTLTLAAVVRLGLSQNHIDPEHGWGLIAAFTLPWICLAGWPILAAALKGNGATLDFGLSRHRPHIRLGVLAGLTSLALASIAAFLTQKVFGPISSSAGDAGKQQHGAVLVTFALLALIGAPIVEEIAFRGMLFGALTKSSFTPLMASLISAGVFALFHFEPKRFLVLFVVGAVLGEARRRSGSTSASIVAHMVNNAPAVVSLLGVQIAFFGH
jgi:uncharacterized protein